MHLRGWSWSRVAFLCSVVVSGAMIAIDAVGGPPVIAKPPAAPPPPPPTAQIAPQSLPPVTQREIAARLARLREEQKARLAAEAKLASSDVLKPTSATAPPPTLATIVQKRASDLKNTRADAGAGVDFSGMSVEDMVMLMFFTISSDAREDMKGLLAKMDATRKEREATQEALKLLREKNDEMKAKMTELRVKQLYERELQLRKELDAQRELDTKASEALNILPERKRDGG